MAPVQRHMILSYRRYEKGNLAPQKRLLTFAAPLPDECGILVGVTQMHVRSGSMHGNRANEGLHNEHSAYEIFFPLSRLRRRRTAPAAQCRARRDLDLPPHAVTAGRLQLPSSTDLFGLWRRGDRAFRIMGRWVDDAGAAVALPALGQFGDRQGAADKTAGRAMVPALAVRTMARRQRTLELIRPGLRQIHRFT